MTDDTTDPGAEDALVDELDDRPDLSDVTVTVIKGAPVTGYGKGTTPGTVAESQTDGEPAKLWAAMGAIAPPLSPEGLLNLFAVSDALRQNVDALARNIDGFGWIAEPTIDLDADDSADNVATALYLDRLARWELEGSPPAGVPSLPTPEEIATATTEWKAIARIEKARLKLWIEQSCFESSFVELRQRTRVDLEVVGWGVWEVIRDSVGRPVRFKHVPAHMVRAKRLGPVVEVEEARLSSPVHFGTCKVRRRFRGYVQLDPELGTHGRHFREMGDPRVTSSKTGNVYASVEELLAHDPTDVPANEVLIFQRYYPGSVYGQPVWHGQIPMVKGSRLANDHTVDYLENSAIPRGLLLVADGRVSKTSVQELKNYFATIKGKAENRLAVVQAEAPRDRAFETHGRVQMQFVSLREAQREDATFKGYIEQVRQSVGESFRLPPILRGDTRTFNRATADAALKFAEEQVFAPERFGFDWCMNRRILPALGIRFWRFKSRGPTTSDPEVLAKVADVFGRLGVVVPAELRGVAEIALGIDLLRSPGAWQQLPLALVQAGFVPPGSAAPTMAGPTSPAGPTATSPEEGSAGPGEATVEARTDEVPGASSRLVLPEPVPTSAARVDPRALLKAARLLEQFRAGAAADQAATLGEILLDSRRDDEQVLEELDAGRSTDDE